MVYDIAGAHSTAGVIVAGGTKFGFPSVIFFIFIVGLLALYFLICGVECCEECRSLRRLRDDEYEELQEQLNAANNL